MAVGDKVKALLKLKGRTAAGLAQHLQMAVTSLNNKYYRDGFSAADLIKVAEFANCNLAFVDNANRIIFDVSDLDRQAKRAVADKVKALLRLKGRTTAGLAEHFQMSAKALNSKYGRDSFSAADLIKVAEFANCNLAFVDNTDRINFDVSDLDSVKPTHKAKFARMNKTAEQAKTTPHRQTRHRKRDSFSSEHVENLDLFTE